MFGIPLYDLVAASVGIPMAALLVWLPHGIGHLLDKLDDRRVGLSRSRNRSRREFDK